MSHPPPHTFGRASLPPPVLAAELDAVVTSCVCTVGVDLDTASAELLARVPGLNAARAAAIIAARPADGYPSRAALLDVKGIGPKSYEQAAGFLRLPMSAPSMRKREALDCTAVHPESYPATRILLDALGLRIDQLRSAEGRAVVGSAAAAALASSTRRAELGTACGVGECALAQICQALNAAERDPRAELPGPMLLGTNLSTLEQLSIGQSLDGVVRNVTSFGCFVNVGLKEDGLLHVSKMRPLQGALHNRETTAREATATAGDGGGGDPLRAAFVGQPLRVVVLAVDVARRRLSLGLAPCAGGSEADGEGGGAKRPAGEHDAPGPGTAKRSKA